MRCRLKSQTGLARVAWSHGPAGGRGHRAPRACGGVAGAGSPAADSGSSLRVEHWCGEGVALGTVTGNGAHQKGVIDDEAARWWRGGVTLMVGSSHGGLWQLGLLLQLCVRERDVRGGSS
jgi:hypothetical protein